MAYLRRLHGEMLHEVDNLLNINRRLVGRGLQYVWLTVEVAILLTIYERYATGGVLTILERLDDGDTRAVTAKRPDGKLTLVEDTVELFAKQLSMEYHPVVKMILA